MTHNHEAEALGLRYVCDDEPGYARLRWGRGFTYRDAEGETVRCRSLRRRFEELAIPPAWTEVWICADEDGHLQATGYDDAGRKQYIYHPRWCEGRRRAKFARLADFGRALVEIRARVDEALAGEGLGRERVLAGVVRLLDLSLARIGSEAYRRRYGSYGLTTLRPRHVETQGDVLHLEFRGKSGQPWEIEVEEPALVELVEACLEQPGPTVFKYRDEDGELHQLDAAEVNAYLREIGGPEISAKDFRTWAGTVCAARALWRQAEGEGGSRARKLGAALRHAAERLNNTPAVCRSAYVHPGVLEHFEAGEELDAPEPDADTPLGPVESQVLGLLETRGVA